MNDRIKKLAKNVSELLPDDPKDPQDVYDSFSTVYMQQSTYFSNLGPDNIIKIVLYIYSFKETGDFALGEKMINNLEFSSLITTNGNYVEDECEYCGGGGTVRCHNCGIDGRVDCPTCDGTGDDSEGEPCDDCQGGGEVYCDECGGDGEVRCDECGGDGTVETDRSEITHHFICSWSDEINRPCELEEVTREPAMSEYDFDRLRGTDYITLYYEESSIELRNFVGVNEMYCVTHEDEPRLFMNNRYLQIFWDDSHNFYTYRL